MIHVGDRPRSPNAGIDRSGTSYRRVSIVEIQKRKEWATTTLSHESSISFYKNDRSMISAFLACSF